MLQGTVERAPTLPQRQGFREGAPPFSLPCPLLFLEPPCSRKSCLLSHDTRLQVAAQQSMDEKKK